MDQSTSEFVVDQIFTPHVSNPGLQIHATDRTCPLPPSASGLAPFLPSSGYPKVSGSAGKNYGLPPMTSMTAVSERLSSMSPASFLPPHRKRSFSATDSDAGSGMNEGTKRISSIKSILNPSCRDGANGAGCSNMDVYTLPPLRSAGASSRSQVKPVSPGAGMARQGQDGVTRSESDRLRSERRLTLQREAERMREELAGQQLMLDAQKSRLGGQVSTPPLRRIGWLYFYTCIGSSAFSLAFHGARSHSTLRESGNKGALEDVHLSLYSGYRKCSIGMGVNTAWD